MPHLESIRNIDSGDKPNKLFHTAQEILDCNGVNRMVPTIDAIHCIYYTSDLLRVKNKFKPSIKYEIYVKISNKM